MGKKEIMYIFFICFFIFSCFPEKKISYKYLDDNKSFCKKAYWEIVTYFIDEFNKTEITNSNIWRDGNDYRIEIYNAEKSDKQIIIIRDGKFYLLTKNKKIYAYNANDENVEIFLRKIFVNIGFGKKQKKLVTQNIVYEHRKCDVYEYEIYRNINGLLCNAKVKEWVDKKGMIVRAETQVFRTEFEFNKQKKYVGPLKEIYEIKNHRCYFFLSSKLFDLPDDYELINFKDFYSKQLIKAGKTPAVDGGITTFNIRK